MTAETIKNLIGGREIGLGETFTVRSEFYEDYYTIVTDSNLFDIKMAVSKAKTAGMECNKMPFGERKKILHEAARKIAFSKKELEYVVKYTGMPLKQVKRQVEEIKTTLKIIPDLVEKRIGVLYGRIGRKPVEGQDFFKFLNPRFIDIQSITQNIFSIIIWISTIVIGSGAHLIS